MHSMNKGLFEDWARIHENLDIALKDVINSSCSNLKIISLILVMEEYEL